MFEIAQILFVLALQKADVTVAVTVDPNANRRAISPLIYGVNFGDQDQAEALRWPVRRWGGNGVTRYSWQDDIANHASDWFFYNIESGPDPGTLPDGSAADVFIDQTRQAGAEPIMTVPLIGWTPIDRVRRWGFSVSKYGPQQQTECTATGFPPWCEPDAGNGNHPNGSPITGNDPHDTSREIGPDFVTGWMAHIAGRVGTAGAGRSAILRAGQRARPLELDPPGRPPHASLLRRDLAADGGLRLGDQDAGPGRARPGARSLGLVRVLLVRPRRVRRRRPRPRGARRRALPGVVPAAGARLRARQRRAPRRLSRHPLLPAGARASRSRTTSRPAPRRCGCAR